MYGGLNTFQAVNLYGKPFDSTEFKKGYLQLPPGVYVKKDFSATAWVNLKEPTKQYSVLVSFANEKGKESVWIGLRNLHLHVEISNVLNEIKTMTSLIPLPKDIWMHVAFVLKKGNGLIYLNGTLNNNLTMPTPNEVERKINFIGKDYYDSDLYLAEAIYDNLTIYEGALTGDEVKNSFENDGKLL